MSSASSFVLLGLAVMWAVVLIPMWLRRHDEAEETRSVDRFTTAMHTLSRRETASDQRYVVMPHRSRSVDVHVSGAAPQSRRKRRKALAARRAALRPPMTATARRRRTLFGLLVVTIVTFAAALALGGLRLWAPQLVLDAILVAFVANLVLRGRRAATRPAARSMPVSRREAAPAARRAPAPALAQAAAATFVAPARASFVFDQVAEIDLASAERAAAAASVHAEPTVDLPAYESSIEFDEPEIEIGGRPWEPVPVPRPTYTTKPVAPARRRRAPITEPVLPEAEIAAELEPLDDLEEILDRRWAVND